VIACARSACSIYEAHDGMWDIPAMHRLLDDMLSSTSASGGGLTRSLSDFKGLWRTDRPD
jgi:hypothetical protein